MGQPLTAIEKEKRMKAAATAVVDVVNAAFESGFDESAESTNQPAQRVLDFIASEPWAITPEALELIDGIAQRTNEKPEAVAAKLGRPLMNTRNVEMRNGVAVIPVAGPIFRYANIFTEISGATSIEMLALDFQVALDDPSVESIVLNIDSPGGMASGVAEFADMVRAADKPVTAYIGSLGASAAYWIAAAADTIVVNKAAEVGSVGVVMGMRVNIDKNVREFVSSQSPQKRPDPETDTGRRELQARVDALAQVFVDSVAQYRGVSVETVLNDFGRGGVKLGEAAVGAGMADGLGSLESVIAGLSGGNQRSIQMSATIETSEITRDYIAAEYPAIADAFRKEGRDSAVSAEEIANIENHAAEEERERIKAVEAQAMPGHEDLITSLKFDGKTTGPEAAVKVLAAEKSARGDKLDAMRKDAPEPVNPSTDAPGKPKVDPSLPIDERAKAEWDSDPNLRTEFNGNFDSYLAFARADDAGQVKVLKK